MMFSKALLVIVVSVLLCEQLTEAGKGSEEFHNQCGQAPGMVTPAQPEQPSSAPIIQGLQSCSASLDVSLQASFQVLISECEGIISNGTSSAEVQFAQVALQISLFFQLNVQIEVEVEFCQISGFGLLRDVIEVGIQIDAGSAGAQVAPSPGGGCPLTEALQQACDASAAPALSELSSQINSALEDNTFTDDQQLALLGQLFEAFFNSNPSLHSCVAEQPIPGGGSVGALVEVCIQYEQIATVQVEISGSSPSDCPLLAALNSAAQNQSLPQEARDLFAQLVISITANFTATLDIEARLSCVSNLFASLLEQHPELLEVILSIELPGFGDIYDLLSCSHFCSEMSACPLVEQGLTPANFSSTTSAVTSTAVTSAAPSTPLPHLNCSEGMASIYFLVHASVSGKTCILLDSIITAVGNWSSELQLQFASTLTHVKKDLKSKKKPKAGSSKENGSGEKSPKKQKKSDKKDKKRAKKCVKHLNKFAKKDPESRQHMLDIPIQSNGTYYGTLVEFCLCVKPSFKAKGTASTGSS